MKISRDPPGGHYIGRGYGVFWGRRNARRKARERSFYIWLPGLRLRLTWNRKGG
jgi:hypothetical protein